MLKQLEPVVVQKDSKLFVCLFVHTQYSRTSELRNPRETRNKGVRNFRNSEIISLPQDLMFCTEECAAMITMKHNVAYIEAKALRY